MAMHTPGPWHVSLTDECTVQDRDGCHVLTVTGAYDIEWERMAADARLIAAAPEMLAFLKAMEWDGQVEDDDGWVEVCPECAAEKSVGKHYDDCKLGALIAKAEGRT